MLNTRQNLSKRDPKKLTLRRSLKAPAGHKFVSVDSSQIEARMLAFVAGEDELVEQFREGRDPYAELASKIFGVPAQEIHNGAKAGDKKLKNFRNVGKTGILSAGYGVGAKKFSDTLLRQGVRLADDLEKHAELAKQAHMIYRMSNASIVAFWDTCQQVVEAMCSHVGGTFGAHNEFEYGYGPIAGTGVEAPYIELRGTGYRLWYPNLRWEKGERGRAEYFYDRPRGKNMVKTKLYGGACTENCVQSIAFQLLMDQACKMDMQGIHLIANIHDAWLACVPEGKAEEVKASMESIMSSVPPWLEGFPVACEGEIGDSYEIA